MHHASPTLRTILGTGLLTAAAFAAGCSEAESTTTASVTAITDGSSAAVSSAKAVSASAEPVTLRFSVKGMHCDGCAGGVAETLAKLDGVGDCSVSLANAGADVTVLDRDRADEISESITATLTRLGYDVKAVPTDDASQTG